MSNKTNIVEIENSNSEVITKIVMSNNKITLDQIAVLITTNRKEFYNNKLFATFLDLHKERAIRQYLEISSE